MSSRSTPPPSAPALPIRTRCVIGAGGARSISLLVFCPRRAETLDVSVCERCPRFARVATHDEGPGVECAAAADQTSAELHAGALARSAVLCVRRDAPLDALDDDERELRVIPVVDDSDRYVGAVVRGHPSAPPSSQSRARVPAYLPTVEDGLDHLLPVDERDGIVTAATKMASSRERSVPVVNQKHVVVGLLDDVALLASIARARRASEIMKRCACGAIYTRVQWRHLALVGRMEGAHGDTLELRNCTACHSTLVVPSIEASNVA